MKILHLYYDLCNLYGDYGNLAMLERKLSEKGAQVTVDRLSVGDDINFSDYSLVYIGSGTELNQKVALKDIVKYKNDIKSALDNGTILLTTGNSFEIFGKEITDLDGNRFEGLGFFGFSVTESDKRIVTDAKCKTDIINDTVIGFVNKSSEITGVDTPMFAMEEGYGNCKDDSGEGIVYGNFYGTHIIGPVLVRNPALCDFFADKLIQKTE